VEYVLCDGKNVIAAKEAYDAAMYYVFRYLACDRQVRYMQINVFCLS
jgi:hypothetical protein